MVVHRPPAAEGDLLLDVIGSGVTGHPGGDRLGARQGELRMLS
jgi:hypothetical protein